MADLAAFLIDLLLSPPPHSGIRDVSLWRLGYEKSKVIRGDQLKSTITGLSRTNAIFNIAITGSSLRLGFIDFTEEEHPKHGEIRDPSPVGKTFRGLINADRSFLFYSPSDASAFITEPSFPRNLYSNYVLIARSLVENGLPWSYPLDNTMSYDTEGIFGRVLNTINDIACMPLTDES